LIHKCAQPDATSAARHRLLLATFRNTSNPRRSVGQLHLSNPFRYYILAIEGQFHLPSVDECTVEFLCKALSGRKKVITNRDLFSVKVPRYREFNAAQLYQHAMRDDELQAYLPEPSVVNKKPISSQFLYKVSFLPLVKIICRS